jgi:hypothetical protein
VTKASKHKLDNLKDPVRGLECDDDEQHFKERLRTLTKTKPPKDD